MLLSIALCLAAKIGNGLYFLLHMEKMWRNSYSVGLLGERYESSTTWGPKTVRISSYLIKLKLKIKFFSNMLRLLYKIFG